MNEEIMSVYRERVNRFRLVQKKMNGKQSLNSFMRLVVFLFLLFFFYQFFINAFSQTFLGLSLLTLVLFIVLVLRGTVLESKAASVKRMVRINENELAVQDGGSSFLDDGDTFKNSRNYVTDLSVFGKHSLYHVLNRTGSISGKAQLRKLLADPLMDPVAVVHNQLCIRELAKHAEFRQQLLANTLSFSEEAATLTQLQQGIDTASFAVLEKTPWKQLAWFWPILGLLVSVHAVYSSNYRYLFAFMIVGLLALSLVFRKTSQLYHHVSKKAYLFTQYADCFALIQKERFEHPFLQEKQRTIADAATAFRKLSRLIGIFDLRMSMLSIFSNGLFWSELICARAYLRWNRSYQHQISRWVMTMGEIEALNSLATFHYNHPAFVFPELQEGHAFIRGEAVSHPLMTESLAVSNDVSIGEKNVLHLITGSNMSGKSTFLRTVGLNLLLAQTGAPVFARSFRFTPLRLLTSFHHVDSLEEGTSYFYAELTCLRDIIHALSDEQPTLVLLDEVMRGTNSGDKHDGTALLIRKLLQFRSLTMIATHDTELGVLAETYPGKMENFCFESEPRGGGLYFDFTMRKGIAKTRNATYLMQQMGIV